MNVRFFNPALIYKEHQADYDTAYKRVMENGDLILRQDVEDFEKNLAAFTGSKFAVGLNSGTDALYLSLWALGIGRGDEVLVPSHTFVATAQVVAQLGAIPVLYDMTNGIVLTDSTKAIIPAHISGEITTDMQLLKATADAEGIDIIEDACQALGATQYGKMAGTFGRTGCFSFYPAKILGAFGDAGGLVTDDENLASEIAELRNHYKKDYSRWGINSRLDNLQAAFLNVRIAHLKEMLARRKEVAEFYLKELKGVVGLPGNIEGRVWQDFIITFKNQEARDTVYDKLKEMGVETMKNEYPMPCGKMPIADIYEAASLRIPCNDVLTNGEVAYVAEAVKRLV